MTQEIILKRLSIIKRIFNIALTQADNPETISFMAILSFHDSIDMFMNLAAEYRNIKNYDKNKTFSLMEHYNILPDITLQSSVKKINDRRNSLKHNGLIPAKIEIEDSKSTTSLFFKDNTQKVFGIDFETISLAQLISDPALKNYIIVAEELLAKNDFKKAIISIGKAYYTLEKTQVLNLSKTESHNFWEQEISSSLPEITHEGEIFIQSPFDDEKKVKIDETLFALNQIYRQNFGFIFTAIQNMTLGVDYRDIVRFKRIVPTVVAETSEGLVTAPIVNEDQLNKEKVDFALQFIIEFAFKVQDR